MVLKYSDEVFKGKIFKMYNEEHPDFKCGKITQYFMHLYPWFIAPSGEFWYDFAQANMTHNNLLIISYINDCLLKTINMIEKPFLYADTNKGSHNYQSNFKKPVKFNKFQNAYDITAMEIRDTINTGLNEWVNHNKSLFDFEKGYFSENMKDLCNSIYNSKKYVYKIFQELYFDTNNMEDVTKKLFNIYESKLIDWEHDMAIPHIPFVDDNCFPCFQEESHYRKELLKINKEDLLVQLMGFDKISSILKKTIITSKSNPYEYFYEYIKNGFSIIQVPKLIYDRDKQDFKFHQNKYINSGVNRIYENKIKKLGLSNLVK